MRLFIVTRELMVSENGVKHVVFFKAQWGHDQERKNA